MIVNVESLKLGHITNINIFQFVSCREGLNNESFIKPTNDKRKDYIFPCVSANSISYITKYELAEYFVHVVVKRNRIEEIAIICE